MAGSQNEGIQVDWSTLILPGRNTRRTDKFTPKFSRNQGKSPGIRVRKICIKVPHHRLWAVLMITSCKLQVTFFFIALNCDNKGNLLHPPVIALRFWKKAG